MQFKSSGSFSTKMFLVIKRETAPAGDELASLALSLAPNGTNKTNQCQSLPSLISQHHQEKGMEFFIQCLKKNGHFW